MANPNAIEVEVAYACAEQQCSISVSAPKGSTVRAAIERSRILERFPEVDLAQNRVGIYGRLCELGDTISPGDRVEIYQQLRIDPKLARRQRSSN
jgi:uncharacterized protein